ncbi:carbon-monoxide dehydrogenase small subunit [Bradyrhizobium japonicum]|uniref:Carbon-monoxide dehydrogenase small subunit n=1 Tax=Bradyrhizobium elkanii TaxID=29448 RepID=A0ABV4FDN4_BRAEL|nr:(2Fe-2S)-binding protein [Bradyrhizobium elkanii]MBP2431913.1 carbon-monoxide dehydrogenase small subunit [Bradyrhizobium elkanii]MCP1735013.1 carbon-monoxide dehydrogenase small subunit [Bradyrhizobium elkanii]MCP1752558.1 carbon-monoxide dehydrogenase small subunit [Bradyrhizobium elkanii]MCP1975130.1 carbon-monoxide dehydrogenase small subunit [Bradyrhizobium elkanii]MCP1978331.1 carbon-monoxide dehydrogenase small subunit [Bradyrhizobium elkanii]
MTQVLAISFSLNGKTIAVDIPAYVLLIDLIRDRLGLKGTKRSCDMEVCGACTVLLDGEPVSSCTTLAVDVDRREVTTIEGVTPPDGLSRIQEAFVLHGGLQCGFCTPGFIMAVTALLKTTPHPTDAEIRHYLHGNLCRCTGYTKIFEAVKSLAIQQASQDGV